VGGGGWGGGGWWGRGGVGGGGFWGLAGAGSGKGEKEGETRKPWQALRIVKLDLKVKKSLVKGSGGERRRVRKARRRAGEKVSEAGFTRVQGEAVRVGKVFETVEKRGMQPPGGTGGNTCFGRKPLEGGGG